MVFASATFLFFFLPATLLLFLGLNRAGKFAQAKHALLFASFVYYAWWKPVYLPILLCTILFNYALGRHLIQTPSEGASRAKAWLVLGVSANLGLLGYFKYWNFFLSNVAHVTSFQWTHSSMLLPLGISFFTFQQVAYLVDAYRGRAKQSNLLDYALFVSFFPQLIAGPIVHHAQMIPQFNSQRIRFLIARNFTTGFYLFAIGLFKKLVVADTLSIWAQGGFDQAQTLNLIEAWVTSLSYTFQLYFDFSAYSDMAIGLALLINIRLPKNFDSPYKASTLRDFWRRWHITLSGFLREYVYIPLGGNRHGMSRTLSAIFITFLLGGVWHGAGWMFVLWGSLHGLGMIVCRLWAHTRRRLPTWLGWLITFNFLNVTWVFFRAERWSDAVKVLKGMSGLGGVVLPPSLTGRLQWLEAWGVRFGLDWMPAHKNAKTVFLWLLACFAATLLFRNSMERRDAFKAKPLSAVGFALMALCALLYLYRVSEFIYFEF